MNVILRRRASFSAAHSTFLASRTLEQNRALYGEQTSAAWDGHNYIIEVAVSGPVDERTGMVVNIAEIDHLLKEHVVSVLNGKFLNRDVPFFQSRMPTVANIVIFVRDAFTDLVPTPGELTSVVVWATPTLSAAYFAEAADKAVTNAMIFLTRSYDFSASHRLHSPHLSDEENSALFGKCNNPNGHGHNYDIEVTLAGTPDSHSGILFPTDELDAIVKKEVLLPLDHKHLNYDVEDFADLNPTSEMLAVVIWNRLARRLPTEGDPRLAKVVVRETARNYFEYSGV